VANSSAGPDEGPPRAADAAARLDFFGYTLVVEADAAERGARVVEYDRAGRKRWEIAGLRSAMTAQSLPGGRVLIAQFSPGCVTERDTRGKVLWRHDARDVVYDARRLPNGNALVVTPTRVYEVDRAGREAAALTTADIRFAGACKLRGGHTGALTAGGEFVRYDASGKQVRSFRVGEGGLSLATVIQALPNDHIVVALYAQNKVAEFDADGREVWQASVRRPSTAYRLPNGHTLVATRLSRVVSELDRKGQVVAVLPVGGRVLCASRR
jgi:outer membrane protein assembly factor BamB